MNTSAYTFKIAYIVEKVTNFFPVLQIPLCNQIKFVSGG